MDKKEIFELFDFMTRNGKSTFVDEFSGLGKASLIPGFSSFDAPEGNGIRSEATGATFEPQYETIRRGNHLEVQYRQDGNLIKSIILGDLFPKETPVVIITGNEVLRRVCPMFERRSEVNDWIMLVHNYCQRRQEEGNPVPYWWKGQMLELAKFLYQNRAEKIEDRSIWAEMFV